MPAKYGSRVTSRKALTTPTPRRTAKGRELSQGEEEAFKEQSAKSILSAAKVLERNQARVKEQVVIASDKLLEVALLVQKKNEVVEATWAWLKAYPTDPRYEGVRTKVVRVEGLLRDCFFWCHLAETMNRQQYEWLTLHGPGLAEEKVVFDSALLTPTTKLWDDFVRERLEALLKEIGV